MPLSFLISFAPWVLQLAVRRACSSEENLGPWGQITIGRRALIQGQGLWQDQGPCGFVYKTFLFGYLCLDFLEMHFPLFLYAQLKQCYEHVLCQTCQLLQGLRTACKHVFHCYCVGVLFLPSAALHLFW